MRYESEGGTDTRVKKLAYKSNQRNQSTVAEVTDRRLSLLPGRYPVKPRC